MFRHEKDCPECNLVECATSRQFFAEKVYCVELRCVDKSNAFESPTYFFHLDAATFCLRSRQVLIYASVPVRQARLALRGTTFSDCLFVRPSQIVCSFFCYQKYEHDILTRSSAVAKRPRDASFLSVVSFVASILQYLERSFFIISYFSFGFTSGYNSILFCYLRRNVKPCCHTHDLS